MLKHVSAALAPLFVLLVGVIYAQTTADDRQAATGNVANAGQIPTTGVLDARHRNLSLGSLDVFLPDDYSGSLPIAVVAKCVSASETPSLAIDAATFGASAQLLNITLRSDASCSSYEVSTAAIARAV